MIDKWKIDIWHGHSIVDSSEHKDLDKLMEWYKRNWEPVMSEGGFSFHVYNTNYRKNGEVK